MPQSLVVRADASSAIGTGHVMRCIALAQGNAAAGGSARFVYASMPAALQKNIAAQGFELHQMNETPGSHEDASALLKHCDEGDWVVLDGYVFGDAYQQHVHDHGMRCLFVDDYGHADHYSCSVVLNQNIAAEPSMYRSSDRHVQFLLGTRYALLRDEFARYERPEKKSFGTSPRNILVTLGGGDDHGSAEEVIKAIGALKHVSASVQLIMGAANPRTSAIQALASEAPFELELVQHVDHMRSRMAWAHIAVSAGGSTCWELAYMGLPNLMFILADNQDAIAKGIDAYGAGVCLGRYPGVAVNEIRRAMEDLLTDTSRLDAMSARGYKLVDGMGRVRVLDRLMEIA